MKVKVRKIAGKKALHIQYISPKKDMSIICEAMKEIKRIKEAAKSACRTN